MRLDQTTPVIDIMSSDCKMTWYQSCQVVSYGKHRLQGKNSKPLCKKDRSTWIWPRKDKIKITILLSICDKKMCIQLYMTFLKPNLLGKIWLDEQSETAHALFVILQAEITHGTPTHMVLGHCHCTTHGQRETICAQDLHVCFISYIHNR